MFLGTGCAPRALTQPSPPTPIPPRSGSAEAFSLNGTCDIAVRGETVRTAIRAVESGDSVAVACVDELGVTLVMVSVGPRHLRVGRWFPPLRGRCAERTGLALYGLAQAHHVRTLDSGTYTATAAGSWTITVTHTASADTITFSQASKLRFRGTSGNGTYHVEDRKGRQVLDCRW